MKRIAQQSIARGLMLTLVIAGAVGLSGPARAQNLIPIPTCRQIWDDAANEAARAALARANRDAGAAPNGAATAWSSSWTQSWRAAWTSAGGTLVPGKDGDCCHIDWFELAVMAGKNGWTQAWQAAPNLSGAAAAWQAKFAAAYADEWANVWFVYYPWLCAQGESKCRGECGGFGKSVGTGRRIRMGECICSGRRVCDQLARFVLDGVGRIVGECVGSDGRYGADIGAGERFELGRGGSFRRLRHSEGGFVRGGRGVGVCLSVGGGGCVSICECLCVRLGGCLCRGICKFVVASASDGRRSGAGFGGVKSVRERGGG